LGLKFALRVKVVELRDRESAGRIVNDEIRLSGVRGSTETEPHYQEHRHKQAGDCANEQAPEDQPFHSGDYTNNGFVLI
jgi:hypothetical protein